MVGILLDVLVRLLHLDFAYGRYFQPEQPEIEAVRFAPCAEPTQSARQVGAIVESWLTEHQPSVAYAEPRPFGAGAVSIIHVWLGPDKDAGAIVLGAARTDFPSENETLLLHVATNQAVIALHRIEVRAERTRTEAVHRRSEERFRSYFELGLVGMAITSPTKGCLEVNDQLCEMLGRTRSELLQMTWAELTHPDDLAADVAQFNRISAGEIDGYSMDKRFIRKDGQIVNAIISVKGRRRREGSVDYFMSLVQDITDRKNAEKARCCLAREQLERRVIKRTSQLAAWSTSRLPRKSQNAIAPMPN